MLNHKTAAEVAAVFSNREIAPGSDPPQVQLLALSFCYPPLAYPRSIHVARLLKYLQTSTVLVCGDETEARRDETIDNGAEACLKRCLRVPFEISSRQRFVNRLTHRICRPIWRHQNMAPDKYKTWEPAVLRELATYMREESYSPDVLVTFGQPFSSHVIGLELKRRYELPWLAHFSDPWVDNPFNRYDAHTTKVNLRLERRVCESADVLAFTSPETLDLVMRKYPLNWKNKACVVPQSFDEALFPAVSATTNPKLIVRYIGNFYGHRTPAPLIAALRRTLAQDTNSLANVCFELIGVCDREMIRQNGGGDLPQGLLAVRSPVAYGESLRLMSEADGLLIVDAPGDVSVFLPSKLIDYAGADRPLLGFTPSGTAATLIRQLGGTVADPSNIDEMSKSLEHFIDLLRLRRSMAHPDRWGNQRIRSQYEAPTVARAFAEVLKGMLGK